MIRLVLLLKQRKGTPTGMYAYKDVGGTTPWMEEVERRLEQPPRALPGANAEVVRLYGYRR